MNGSNGASASRPSCRFCRRFASPWPVFRNHRSPGALAGLRNHGVDQRQRATETCSHTRGAVKPAIDCADKNHAQWVAIANRADDRGRRTPEAGRIIGRRQCDGNSLMPMLFQERHHQIQLRRFRPAPGMRTNVKPGIGSTSPTRPPNATPLFGRGNKNAPLELRSAQPFAPER